MSLQSNPVDNNNEYITFQVTRINEHHHNQVTQIRGDKRKDVSNIVSIFLLNLNIFYKINIQIG